MATKIEQLYALQIRTLDEVKQLALDSKDRIAELYQELIDETEADANLSDLTSTSKTAIWRLWCFVTAFQLWLHEFLWIRYKAILDDAARYAQSHTLAWYRQKVLEYQHGDSVQVINGAITYNPIVAANQIIAASSVKQTALGHLVVKAAKDDGSGNLVPLDAAELTGLEGYIDNFQDAGVVISVVSQNADVLKLEATVYYLPAIQPLDDFQPAFEAAVNSYLSNLTFDGKFRRIGLIDELQKLAAFHDISFTNLQASVAYVGSPNFVDIDLEYETVAGYMNVDSNFELDTTITYQAYE